MAFHPLRVMVIFLTVIFARHLRQTGATCFPQGIVCEAITNNDYFGEIARWVIPLRLSRNPKSRLRNMHVVRPSPQDLDDEDFNLTIDKANYFAFKVDDIEEAHSHVNFQSPPLTVPLTALPTSLTKTFLATCRASSSHPSTVLQTLLTTL